MKLLSETNSEMFQGKTVLVRFDFNVPLENGKVDEVDAGRIRSAQKTIDFLKNAGAKIFMLSHFGRDPHESLQSVAEYMKVSLYPLMVDKETISEPMVLLENVRQDEREEKNDESFARELAQGVDFFINDAFSVSHRVHASLVALPKLLPSFAGFQLEEEVKNLSQVFNAPHPSILVLGGAKFETKLPVIEKLLPTVDTVIIGGALANNFYKEHGKEVGRSLIDTTAHISHIINDEKIKLAEQVIVENDQGKLEKNINEVTYDEKIVDSAPVGLEAFSSLINNAQFIIWNGPMGNYENGFTEGTKKIAEMIIGSKAHSIVGGGDSEALLEELGMQDKFSFVSTGGGAMLEYLAQGTLPGIEALG